MSSTASSSFLVAQVCETEGRIQVGNEVCMETHIRDVLQGGSGLELIISFLYKDRPLVEITVALRHDEFLDELVLSVAWEPLAFDLKHKLCKAQGHQMVTVGFDPGLHEFRFKGVNDAAYLIFSWDFLVSKELFTGIVKLAEIGDGNQPSRQEGRLDSESLQEAGRCIGHVSNNGVYRSHVD